MATPIIAFANQKGGVGKTTTAINLAACLTAQRKHILLIDLDPQGNATSGLGMEKQEGASMYRVLIGEARIEDQIRATSYKRLDMVTSELDLAGAEVDIARSEDYLYRLRDALKNLADNGTYDYIMIDCPPSLGILTINCLAAADSLIIPIQCEYYALEGLSTMSKLIEQIKQAANPKLEIEGIVMTMYDTRLNLAQQVVQEVTQYFGGKLYETLIPRSVRLGEAPSYGKPIIAYDPRSTGSAAYLQLAKEFSRRRRLWDAHAAAAIQDTEVLTQPAPDVPVTPEETAIQPTAEPPPA